MITFLVPNSTFVDDLCRRSMYNQLDCLRANKLVWMMQNPIAKSNSTMLSKYFPTASKTNSLHSNNKRIVYVLILTLISPWQIFCRWHWCNAHSTWNVIHFFSSDVKNGLVDTRSYRLCFTYSRITSATFSVTWTRWNGKQLTAFARLFCIYITRSACVSNGKLGSCLTNTLITISPSSERTLATLKNLVLPMLHDKHNKKKTSTIFVSSNFNWPNDQKRKKIKILQNYLDSYCKSDSNEPIK